MPEGDRIARLVWPLLFVALVINGMRLVDGGYMHYEGQFFLAAHLDGRSAFQQIFSAHYNEWDCYQGRELSFLLGWIDSWFVALSTRYSLPHLYSVTGLTSVFATAVALWRLLPRMARGLSVNASGLIVALFLTTPVASLSGYYYRPAKAAAALLSVLVVSAVVSAFRSGITARRHVFAIIALATLMGASDRLGIFLIVAIGITVVIVRWPIDRAARRVLMALAIALGTNAVWSLGIGPQLARMADGFLPDTVNQVVRLRYTFGNFIHYRVATGIWTDQVAFFFGNSGVFGAAVVVIATIAVLARKEDRRTLVAMLAGGAMAFALFVSMYAKLISLAWVESRRVYYYIPMTVAIAIGVGVLVAAAMRRWPRHHITVQALLGVVVIANLAALPAHRSIVAAREHRPQILEGRLVRECIRDTSAAIDARLSPGGAEACARIRMAAFGTIGDGPKPPAAVPNPVLYCRKSGNPHPAFLSLGP